MSPRKRTTTIAAVAALAATAAVASPGGAQQPPPPAALELVARDRDSRFGYVDAAPRGREGAGDVFTVSARLRDAAGRPSGRAQAAFVQTSGNHAHGSATFALASGRIAAAGLLDDPGDSDELVVVGGTGAYAGVHGTVAITEARGATRFRFTFAR